MDRYIIEWRIVQGVTLYYYEAEGYKDTFLTNPKLATIYNDFVTAQTRMNFLRKRYNGIDIDSIHTLTQEEAQYRQERIIS